jgi:hypothetical protein
MTLDQYLERSAKSEAEFGADIGMSRSQIWRLRRGWKPSWDAIVAIERATGGKVKPNDWPRQADAGDAA